LQVGKLELINIIFFFFFTIFNAGKKFSPKKSKLVVPVTHNFSIKIFSFKLINFFL